MQFNRKDAQGNRTLFPKNFVFAEVEYAADKNYQDEAHAEGINANGKYQHSLAGLKHLPTDGYYRYRTNPNPETDPWIITGAMKVTRLLTRAEQAELVEKAGREPQKIQDGDVVTDEVVNGINQEIAKQSAEKYSLIGKKGAEALDHAEEVSTRLDNLDVARQMEEAKKDALAIKMATGWERGADGKWRYEAPDLKIKAPKEWLDKGDMKLRDIVDDKSLFKAYPELGDINIAIDPTGRYLLGEGEYNAYLEAIILGYPESIQNDRPTQDVATFRLKTLNEVIAHEIQRHIQYIEGFARGGNSRNIRKVLERIINENQDASDYAKDKLKEWATLTMAADRLSDLYKPYINSDNEWLKNKAVESYWDAMNELDNNEQSALTNDYPDGTAKEIAESGYHVDEAEKELRRLAKDTKESIPEGNMSALDLVSKLTDALENNDDYSLYNKLGGEVEARNVQSRMGMSPEERRNTLAEETEDVARKDQIFLYGGNDAYSLKGVNNQSLFDAIHTLYSKGKTFAENIYKRKFFDVTQTPDFMKRLGLTGNKFTIRYGVISRHFGKDNQHDFTEEEWKQIPQALSNPILITEYYQDNQQEKAKRI